MIAPAISISTATDLHAPARAAAAGATITSVIAAIVVNPPVSTSHPSFSRRRQSFTCEQVALYRLATSKTDTPDRKLSAAIRARSASLRCFRTGGIDALHWQQADIKELKVCRRYLPVFNLATVASLRKT